MDEMDVFIPMVDEDGNEIRYELLDEIVLGDKSYLVMLAEDDEEGFVEIFELTGEDEENYTYDFVEDEELGMKIFELFKERNPELCE